MNPDKRRERRLAKRKDLKENERRKEQSALSVRTVSNRTTQITPNSRLALFDEVAHIRDCAIARETRVVIVGSLVLFSTTHQDAWLLDHEDFFAACLLRGGKPQKPCITENTKAFAVDWQMQFGFDGDDFVVIDRQEHRFVFSDYPVAEIQHQIENYDRLKSELNE